MRKMKVAILGGGNMGLAFAKALLKGGIVDRKHLLVIDRSISRKPHILKELKCLVASAPDTSLGRYDLVVLSVKPQDSVGLLTQVSSFVRKSQLVISLMTGIRLSALSKALNNHKRIVRAMPNLPAHVGKGVTVWKPMQRLSGREKLMTEAILGSAGVILEVQKENLIDAATAVPATGPGYFYYFLEFMIKASQKLGFSKKDSEFLIRETMRGSLALWEKTELPVEELRRRVTSKGGTTKAAVTQFTKAKLGSNIIKGILAADRRAKELAK